MNCKEDCEKVEKPWGSYTVLEKEKSFWLKKIFVRRGEELSLQSHSGRVEVWVVLEGEISAVKGDQEFTLGQGEFLRIEKKEKHRIRGLSDAWILEAAFGRLSEDDIIRYEDKYGRAK